MTTSAPRSRTHSTLLVPVVVATVAPRCLANWIAYVPTPPEPAAVARPRVNLVTHGEARHGGADAADDAGEVVAEDERRLVGEDELELPVADLRVEPVDAGGVDVDEHVVVANRGFQGVASLHRPRVLLDQVRLHRWS